MSDLRKLAEDASPGPWHLERGSIAWMIRERAQGPQVANVIVAEDAAYIVAVSPDVVLALLDRLAEAGDPTLRYRTATGKSLVKTAWTAAERGTMLEPNFVETAVAAIEAEATAPLLARIAALVDAIESEADQMAADDATWTANGLRLAAFRIREALLSAEPPEAP